MAWGKHDRTRAYTFRKTNEFKRIIHIVDVDENCSRVKARGHMNVTNHRSVLHTLLLWSRRFSTRTTSDEHESNQHTWSLNKTGTIDTSGLTLYNKKDARQKEIRESLNIPVPDKVLQVHGYAPPTGTVQLIYENVNRISNKMCNNEKLERMGEIHDELEVDIAAYSEHQLNMKNNKNCNGFNQLFKGGEAAVQSIVAHNVHNIFGKEQQGGTRLIMFGPITEQLDFNESGKDDMGLGCWTVMTLQRDGVQTGIVCGYNPWAIRSSTAAQPINNTGDIW